MSDNKVKVCSKYDILLEKDKLNNNFTISFTIKNDAISLINIIDYSFFKIISDLNKDILEVVMDEPIYDKIKMFFLFKPIAEDFGIMNKSMLIETEKCIRDSHVIFKSKDLLHDVDMFNEYDRIDCNLSELDINIINNNLLHVIYTFNIDIHEDLPIYMENLIGLIMKKIFLKLKLFIENIK
jgi:hypothetical protein